MIRRLRQLRDALERYGRAADQVVGMNRRNGQFVYRHNARKHYPLVDDKLRCKELMAKCEVPMARTLGVCEGLFDVERTVQELSSHSNFVVKPSNGSGGKGILVLGAREEHAESGVSAAWRTPSDRLCSVDEVRSHIANIVFGAFGNKLTDRALIERKITPHPYFLELWPRGVCDLRLIMIEGCPLMAMLRVPTERSGGKANLHQGGLGVAVDIETGRTFRACLGGKALTVHPETGTPLLGAQVPAWLRVVEVARLAASAVPLGYLGVDLVIDDSGTPLVLELNARPGLEIQNVNGLTLEAALHKARAS